MERVEALSVAGFVQQLAVNYIGHGYWFYVTGRVPEGKDSREVDRRLSEKYDLNISKWERARRKVAGLGNARMIRHGRFFVLIATQGQHPFKEAESVMLRDVRRDPIAFADYSIGYHQGVDRLWHSSVRIHPQAYQRIKSYFIDLACRRSAEQLLAELNQLPFERYAPVRRQLLHLLRHVNRARKLNGMGELPMAGLRLRREVAKVFSADLAA